MDGCLANAYSYRNLSRRVARGSRLKFFLMSPLPRGEVTVQFFDVLENGHAGKRLDNFKNLPNLGLQMDEPDLAAAFFELLPRVREHAETSAADKFQVRKIEDRFFDLPGQSRSQLAFQIRRRGGIQAAGEVDGDCARLRSAGFCLDLDFKWHISVMF